MNKVVFHRKEGEQCPECDGNNVREMEKEQAFSYGTGERAVELTARMPVFECQDCGFTFTDYRADKARQEAICRHEGIFTPSELVTVRMRADMSRAAFAAAGRFGTASLARWETGALPQNGANDQLIYLMQFPAVRALLQARRENETLLSEELVRDRMESSLSGRPAREHRKGHRARTRSFRVIRDPEKLEPIALEWKLRIRATP